MCWHSWWHMLVFPCPPCLCVPMGTCQHDCACTYTWVHVYVCTPYLHIHMCAHTRTPGGLHLILRSLEVSFMEGKQAALGLSAAAVTGRRDPNGVVAVWAVILKCSQATCSTGLGGVLPFQGTRGFGGWASSDFLPDFHSYEDFYLSCSLSHGGKELCSPLQTRRVHFSKYLFHLIVWDQQ